MKAFKNRLEEMAEATVNALDYSDSKVKYPDISIVQKWPKEIILPLYDLYKNTSVFRINLNPYVYSASG
jgi:hypothetical protein